MKDWAGVNRGHCKDCEVETRGEVPEPRKFFGPRIYFDILGGSGA